MIWVLQRKDVEESGNKEKKTDEQKEKRISLGYLCTNGKIHEETFDGKHWNRCCWVLDDDTEDDGRVMGGGGGNGDGDEDGVVISE